MLNDNTTTLSIPAEGTTVASSARIPLQEKVYDNQSLVTLANDGITFANTGDYLVTFTVNGYVNQTGTTFSPQTDFLAVALVNDTTSTPIFGNTVWTSGNVPASLTASGVVTVTSTSDVYALKNLTNKTAYIVAAPLSETTSTVTAIAPAVTLEIVPLTQT